MANFLDGKLVVGISSSALFDTREEHEIFQKLGKTAFVQHQIQNEDIPFKKGTAFSLIEGLLRLNPPQTREEQKVKDEQLVEVIVLSHNQPAAGLRAMNSIDTYGLNINRAAFVGDGALGPYLPPFQVSLFLSKDEKDVRDALLQDVPAALLYDPPEICTIDGKQLRIAFDGDAVLFSDESEKIYQEQGPKAFFEHEKAKAKDPMKAGPFAPFLTWLHKVHKMSLPHLDKGCDPVRIALITARNNPAHKRVILTLRAWDIEVDELLFLGGLPKEHFLNAFAPHIFFDDQERYTDPASKLVPTARVLYGVKNKPEPAQRIAVPTPVPEVPVTPETVLTVPMEVLSAGTLNKRDFEIGCRSIFRSYTPMASGKNTVLNERFRVFISENSAKTPEERAKILKNLSRYDLTGVASHEPMLNREIESMLVRKLAKIANTTDDGQQSLGL
jgi:5'-nucleotidase